MNEQTWIDSRVDRSNWPSGDWDGEPDKVQWTDEATGFACLAKRQSSSGHWCGYVGVEPGHAWHGKGYDEVRTLDDEDEAQYPDVHGGLTYADECQEGPPDQTVCHIPEPGKPEHLWWLGFDCHHSGDTSPGDIMRGYVWDGHGQYRSLRYVKNQCRKLAKQAQRATVHSGAVHG